MYKYFKKIYKQKCIVSVTNYDCKSKFNKNIFDSLLNSKYNEISCKYLLNIIPIKFYEKILLFFGFKLYRNVDYYIVIKDINFINTSENRPENLYIKINNKYIYLNKFINIDEENYDIYYTNESIHYNFTILYSIIKNKVYDIEGYRLLSDEENNTYEEYEIKKEKINYIKEDITIYDTNKNIYEENNEELGYFDIIYDLKYVISD